VFNSWIVVPLEARAFVSFNLSSREIPGIGAGRRADPPPGNTPKKLVKVKLLT